MQLMCYVFSGDSFIEGEGFISEVIENDVAMRWL